MDITRFANISGSYFISTPKAVVRINGKELDCHRVDVTQSGHSEVGTCNISFPNSQDAYLDFATDPTPAIVEVFIGYDIIKNNKAYYSAERIFYGRTPNKSFQEGKSDGSFVSIPASDFSIIAREAKMTGTLDEMTIEQIIRAISERVYGVAWTKKNLILNLPENLKKFKYGSLGDAQTFEVDQASFWSVAEEIASDFGLENYFTPDGQWYFGEYAKEEDTVISKVYEFTRKVNIGNVQIMTQTPTAIYNKVAYKSWDEDEQEVNTVSFSSQNATKINTVYESLFSAQQGNTLYLTNDKILNIGILQYVAKIRLWEELRQLKVLTISSQYGIPNLRAGNLIKIKGYHKNDGFWFLRSVVHSIDKQNGYQVTMTCELPNPFLVIKIIDSATGVTYGPITNIDIPSAGSDEVIIYNPDWLNCPDGGLLFPADGTYDANAAICWKKSGNSYVQIDCSEYVPNNPNYVKSYYNRWGLRVHPINKVLRQHDGIDIDGVLGAEVYASADGVVMSMGTGSTGYGNYIKIRVVEKISTGTDTFATRPTNWILFYAHLDHFASGMSVGKSVSQGEVIGYMGSTGASTGVHLHFELRKEENGVETAVDPIPCIRGA